MGKIGLLFCFLAAASGLSFCQGVAPGVSIGASIGVTGGQSLTGQTTLSAMTDANYTLAPNEWWVGTLVVPSSVTLTATRNIVPPANPGQHFCVENQSSGGHQVQIIASTGTGTLIPNSSTGTTCVVFDGTNYVSAGASSISLLTNSTPNTSASLLNFTNSTTNATGLGFSFSNPSGGVEKGEITGTANQTYGGTGIDTHASTGVAQLNAGTWAVSTALANGTTGTTQAAGDNTTKVATDVYVDRAVPVQPVTSLVTTDCTGAPQTLLITSSITLSTTATITGCQILLQGAGFITGSGTLACIRCTVTNQTGGAIFGTSLVISGLQYDRLSWHSVIGYLNSADALTGADYSAEVLQGLAAISGTGTLYVPCLSYRVDTLGTVNYTFRLVGECSPNGGTGVPVFLSTSATANMLVVEGVNVATTLDDGSIEHLTFYRSVKPTGTPPSTGIGVGLIYAGGWTVQDVGLANSNSNLYCDTCPSYGIGIIDHVAVGWTDLTYTSGSTNLIGMEFAPEADNGNISAQITNFHVTATPIHLTGAISTAVKIHGSAINDIDFVGGVVADTTYGVVVAADTPITNPASDILFANLQLQTDQSSFVCTNVNGTSTNRSSGILLTDTWAFGSGSPVTNCTGLVVRGYQQANPAAAFTLSGSSNNHLDGITSVGGSVGTVLLGSGSNNNYVNVNMNDPNASDTLASIVQVSGTSQYNEIHVQATGAATIQTGVNNSDGTSGNNLAWVEGPTIATQCSGLVCSDHSKIGLNGNGRNYWLFDSTASFGPGSWGGIYTADIHNYFTALWCGGCQNGSTYNLFTMPSNGGFGWGNQAGNAVTGSYACDTQLFRISANSVGVNNCTAGSTVNGSFSTTNLTVNGLTTAGGIPMHTNAGLFQESTMTQAVTGSGATLSTYLVFPGTTQPTLIGTVVQKQSMIASNCYFDGANWVYATTGFCTAFRMNAAGSGGTSGFRLALAPSGTASATVTNFDTTSVGLVGVPSSNGPQFEFNPGGGNPTFGTKNILNVNPVQTADNNGLFQVTAGAATDIPETIQGFTSQTANLTDWKNVGGTVLASVGAAGAFAMPSIALSGGAALTGNQGTGANVAHCTGSFTTGHIWVTDASGNCSDGGAAPAGTVTTSGSPANTYCAIFSSSAAITGTSNCEVDGSGNLLAASAALANLTASSLLGSDGSKKLVTITALPSSTTATTGTPGTGGTHVATQAYADASSAAAVSGLTATGHVLTTFDAQSALTGNSSYQTVISYNIPSGAVPPGGCFVFEAQGTMTGSGVMTNSFQASFGTDTQNWSSISSFSQGWFRQKVCDKNGSSTAQIGVTDPAQINIGGAMTLIPGGWYNNGTQDTTGELTYTFSWDGSSPDTFTLNTATLYVL